MRVNSFWTMEWRFIATAYKSATPRFSYRYYCASTGPR